MGPPGFLVVFSAAPLEILMQNFSHFSLSVEVLTICGAEQDRAEQWPETLQIIRMYVT